MKLKINRVCDLSSISVLPSQSRRQSSIPPGPQVSQHRSQPSQQSFSQGISSQHGIFSQLSQTSLDEAPANDQIFKSQERESSLRKKTCLPPVSYTREESQMPISRPSTNMMRKWNLASVADSKCQVNEELDHRIGVIETTLNKFALILDSVQSDVMQVNKGTKEALLEAEGIRQKLIAFDTSLQHLSKVQDEARSSFDETLKSLSQQLSKDSHQDKLEQIFLVISNFPKQIEASLCTLQTEILMTFTKQMQAMAGNLKLLNQKHPAITLLRPKVTGSHPSPQKKPEPLHEKFVCPKKVTAASSVETGGWKSVKPEKDIVTRRAPYKQSKPDRIFLIQQERQRRVIIESDEEIDEGFSFLIDEKDTGTRSRMVDETEEETKRILRKARRLKRKYMEPIIID